MENKTTVPILIPMGQEEFWKKMRTIIGEEISKQNKQSISSHSDFSTPGLIYKPLYKITEVCKYFQVTRPTIYDWIKDGRIKPYKIKSRVYFLYNDILQLLSPDI
jgi:excisionase family DNA binding protein